MTVSLDIQKSLDLVELTPMEHREMVEELQTDYSVRQICETLGFNRSNLYYHPKSDPSEACLREEIEALSLRYPTYDGVRPWVNRLENLQISRCDQVWVDDITYVCLKGHFIYVCLLMDVFTRMVRAWHISQHLTQSLTLKPLEAALRRRVPEIHHSDQGVQYLSNAYVSMLKHHRIEISVARIGHPCENGYAERLIRTLKEEEVHLNDYEYIHEARSRIGHFITQVYHQKRPHSALDYLTPVEFQRKNLF